MSKSLAVVSAIGLFVAAFALSACGNSMHGAPAMGMGSPHETIVRLQQITPRSINDSTAFMGTLKSRHSSVLQPQVAGTITKILAVPGAAVRAGQALIEIDPEKQKATVNSSVAATESSTADKQTAVSTLKSLEASLRSKQSTLKFARTQERRYALLARQGAVSTESAENYITASSTAEADVQSVQAQIDAQKAAIAKMDRIIKQTTANAEEQQVQLQYFTIKAPFAGVVGDIPFKIGEYVNSDSKITSVTANQPLEVYVSVPAEKAAKLRLGMPVELADADDKVIGEAQVFFISPKVDDQTQSVLVKALYSNADGKLRSNQSVGAKVVWSRQPGLLIPTFAVAHISGQDFVFTAEKSSKGLVAKQKPVELGSINSNCYIVKTGLHDGDRLVVSGVQNLVDGVPIAPETAVSGR